jgi:hypothetical protein
MGGGSPVWGVRACIPVGTEASQLRDLAIKYLRENIANRTVTATHLVAVSFAEAYPCTNAR